MADIGKRNVLRVVRESPHGLYLDGGALGELLLPRAYATAEMRPGDEVDVFVYRDSEDRLVATTLMPHACVNELAVLTVTGVHPQVGAFLDWGLPKDLLLPHKEQLHRLRPGDQAVVFVMLDAKTQRIIATTRLKEHLSQEPPDYKRGQPVQLIMVRDTPLGWTAIIDMRHLGLLYHGLAPRTLRVGQEIKGYVQGVRDDGQIDLTLESTSRARVGDVALEILSAIKSDGVLAITDDSPPDVIRARFDASKRAFKQAVGALLKAGKAHVKPDGIHPGAAPRAPRTSSNSAGPRYLD